LKQEISVTLQAASISDSGYLKKNTFFGSSGSHRIWAWSGLGIYGIWTLQSSNRIMDLEV